MPTIKQINISLSKENTKSIPEVEINNDGFIGDIKSGKKNKQISILPFECIEQFTEKQKDDAIEKSKKINIITLGLSTNNCQVLDHLQIGNVVLEITQIGKREHHSHNQDDKNQCFFHTDLIYCRIIRKGNISINQKIELFPKKINIYVLTLSDRASKGEYEDLSGKYIINSLENYFSSLKRDYKIDYQVIPDESNILKDSILKYTKLNYDLIITTGGTGVGLRDITPDVIRPLLTKEIPGIMEYIRVKYGEKIPNALLSRSIAGLINLTQVYTLPGSVKAVSDYIKEIQRTLEHLIYMIHDIDNH